MRWIALLGGIANLIILLLAMRQLSSSSHCESIKVTLPSARVIDAEVADSPQERATGLSGRSHLGNDAGMLFLFPEAGVYAFWMKDTHIPLDIVWIRDKKVVEVTTLQPEQNGTIPQHTPSQTADAVLEVNAGLASAFELRQGSEVNWADC